MGFFSAIKKMFTSPEQDAKTQEELAGKAGQESAQEAGREAGKDAGKENPAGGRPQAKPAPAPAQDVQPAPEPVPAPEAAAMPSPAEGPAAEAASAPEDFAKSAPAEEAAAEAAPAHAAPAEPAPAAASGPAPAEAPEARPAEQAVPGPVPAAPEEEAEPETAPAAEAQAGPAEPEPAAPAGSAPSGGDSAALAEAEAAPAEAEPAAAASAEEASAGSSHADAAPSEEAPAAAASAEEASADSAPAGPAPAVESPEPKRSVLASLFGFGRKKPAPAPESPAGLEPAGPRPAEINPAGGPAPAPEAPAPSAEAAPEPQPAGGGWALFEAAPAPEQEPVFAQAPAAPSPQSRPGAGSAGPSGTDALTLRLRQAPPRLSAWLDVVLDGVSEAGPLLESRIRFLLESLEAPAPEIDAFVADFAGWLARMEYRELDEFRSELQYRLAIALEMEDEEDERSRLFVKLTDGLAKTRDVFTRQLESLFASHGELDEDFWEQMEELFIMADLGYEAAVGLVGRLRERCLREGVKTSEGVRDVLKREIKEIFAQPRRIAKINPPEIVLMIGVNGAGKTTTIAKLAYRDRMQGRKVMIAAADTFRAAAIDQMRVWAERVGTLFHAKQPGADPASVAFEAVDRALREGVDVLYVDTAGRLQTKVNLMDELSKIRQVIARKHPGAPHRTVLVLDATTGQNALSQAKLFKESAGVDELILTKLDGTAKGGVAIAVALQQGLPITYVGLGEKVEDLRPFSGDDYADALLASV